MTSDDTGILESRWDLEDRIEELEARVTMLSEALLNIRQRCRVGNGDKDIMNIADAALEGTE